MPSTEIQAITPKKSSMAEDQTPNYTAADMRHDVIQHAGQRKKSVGLIETIGPDGQKRTINLEHLSDDDAQLAAQFGYNPVLKREFGYLSTFSFAVSISGLFSTVMTTFSFPLNAGGSASAVWCWLISGAGCMCIAVGVSQTRLLLGGPYLTERLTHKSSSLSPNSCLPILPPEACEGSQCAYFQRTIH